MVGGFYRLNNHSTSFVYEQQYSYILREPARQGFRCYGSLPPADVPVQYGRFGRCTYHPRAHTFGQGGIRHGDRHAYRSYPAVREQAEERIQVQEKQMVPLFQPATDLQRTSNGKFLEQRSYGVICIAIRQKLVLTI